MLYTMWESWAQKITIITGNLLRTKSVVRWPRRPRCKCPRVWYFWYLRWTQSSILGNFFFFEGGITTTDVFHYLNSTLVTVILIVSNSLKNQIIYHRRFCNRFNYIWKYENVQDVCIKDSDRCINLLELLIKKNIKKIQTIIRG